MEAEVRAILAQAVSQPEPTGDLFSTLLDRFGGLGGIDLPMPSRATPARAADFSAP